jgi:ankyrin repeat protein
MSDNPRDRFLDTCVWHGSLEEPRSILAAHPEVASSDIYTAAILGDDAAVRRFLALDPAGATAQGGPRHWDALTYLCFSKYLRLDRERSDGFVRAATALLDAGADPNTGFFDESHQPTPERESVLYGAAGVAHHPEMTRLLLERGADPNDAEVPYHSPETIDNRAVHILVESGKMTPASLATMLIRKFDWHDDAGVEWLLEHGADPNLLTHWGVRPMHHALSRSNPLCYFEWMLDHGGDPALTDKNGDSPFALAARMARADVLELFGKRGFTADLQPHDAFLAACARGDGDAARRLLQPGLIERLESENGGLLGDFASSGNTASVSLMLDLGFHVEAQRSAPRWRVGETALHLAVGHGLLPMVRLLIERGAPLEAKHRSGATPLAVAFRCLVEQSEFTPNPYTAAIAEALIAAGASLETAPLTLAAAVCLERWNDALGLARDATPRDLQAALAAAAIHGKAQAIAVLVDLGVDVNPLEPILEHATPLHNAVTSGSLETVQALANAGAQIAARDDGYQLTPLQWAEYYERERKDEPGARYAEIAAYLRERTPSG